MSGWRPIKATLPNKQIFNSDVIEGFRTINTPAEKDLKLFVSTWKDTKPDIKQHLKVAPDRLENLAGVISNWSKGKKANANDILMFIARGTSKRYRRMSSDFRPKTRSGSLRSGAGSGEATGWATPPLPGIEPRGTERLLKDKHKKQLKKDMEKLLLRSASRSGLNKIGSIRF